MSITGGQEVCLQFVRRGGGAGLCSSSSSVSVMSGATSTTTTSHEVTEIIQISTNGMKVTHCKIVSYFIHK